MKVPVSAYSNKDKLYIIQNKTKIEIPLPETHKVYIKNEYGTNKGYDIFTKELVNVDIKEFNNTSETYKEYKSNDKNTFILPYIEQLFITQPDFFRNYPNDVLTTLTFDIETYNRGNGRFPNSATEPITIISYKINNEETQVINLYNDIYEDKQILEEFLNVFKKYDPDIVVGYNALLNDLEGFDIPYIIQRCLKHNLDVNVFSRFNENTYEIDKEQKEHYVFHGRCFFDVYNTVKADQSLSGIKNRKLDTVAEWYKIEAFKWDDIYTKESAEVIKDERFIKHVKSDVDATYALFKIYFNAKVALAELMGIPLDNVVNCYSSFIPKIFSGRELFKSNYIPFDSNKERYGNANIQAALIGIAKNGLIDLIYGIDAASFYPSVMRTFNLGAETTKFLGFKEKSDEIKFESTKDYLRVRIPDNNFNADFHIEIDKTKISFLKKNFDDFFKLRGSYKYEAQKTKDENIKLMLESQSSAIKVIMNTIYGLNSSEFCKYGDLATAVCIVGFARWILQSVMNRNHDNVVMWHTDGIYLDKIIDLEETNLFVKNMIEETTGMENKVFFEEKGLFEGYFYKKGNYILRKIKGIKKKEK